MRWHIHGFIAGVLALLLHHPAARAEVSGAEYTALTERGLRVEVFTVSARNERVQAVMAEPGPDLLAAEPLLLFTVGGPDRCMLPPWRSLTAPAEFFWERGHRVVSLDMQGRMGSLERFRDRVLEGRPVEAFLERAQAVLDACVERGWAEPGRVVVTGTSRYGYLALRLAAADDRVQYAGGFAPVTDWRDLREFSGRQELDRVAALRLADFVQPLAGKKVFLAIGHQDRRVNTLSCLRFFLDLNAANREHGYGPEYTDLFVTPDAGHRCGPEWYRRGLTILHDAARSNAAAGK